MVLLVQMVLSKSKLKHGDTAWLKQLVYCQVIWVEVQRLQDHCISIWVLVFYYCISNNLQHEQIVIQM